MAPPLIIGTAGHIDHGKTALTRALTGIDTDRLKEEKARGITIELGFAWLDLDGTRLGVVDVPGHERFVRTMVAGATGIDLVLLVVAADEGVMPQTHEHLDICRLLGVKEGIVALTKADLVSEDLLGLAVAEVRETVRSTFLERAPIIPCSAVTGLGLEAIRAAIRAAALRLPGRSHDGTARLPIDRVFTMHGFGTVVTGTLIAGSLSLDTDVEALPGGARGKVRGIHVYGAATNAAVAGQRTAVNIAGVERTDVTRGEVLIPAGTLKPCRTLAAEIEIVPAARAPLSRRSRLLLHAGTTQIPCVCTLLGRETLPQGEKGFAHLQLERPAVILPGDRFILRAFTPQAHYGTTVGGGSVVEIFAPRPRGRKENVLPRLERLCRGSLVERIALLIEAAGIRGMTRTELGYRLGEPGTMVDNALATLGQEQTIFRVSGEGDTFVHARVVSELEQALVARLEAFHAEHPRLAGQSLEELRREAHPRAHIGLVDLALQRLTERGDIVRDRDLVRRPTHTGDQSSIDPLARAIMALYEQRGLEPPRRSEVPLLVAEAMSEPPAGRTKPGEAQASPPKGQLPGGLHRPSSSAPLHGTPKTIPNDRQVQHIIETLARQGELVRVTPDFYFPRRAIEDLRQRLLAYLEAHTTISAQGFKELCGTSRKYAIPLAEYFDAEKVTIRVGDVRKRRG